MSTITLFYGGVVNLGRTMNVLLKAREPFVGIKEMADADLRLVDLECVIANTGSKKLTPNDHYYFRAVPEQTNVLANADIDIVLTANDHSGDYGAEALLEQKNYLDAAGILIAGSGENIFQAFAPVYKKIGEITVAVFSVDTTMPTFAATADSPGNAFLPADNLEAWKETFADKIREAHEKADVVIVAPHWGANRAKKPSEDLQKLAHLLIDLGADAVLGCHSHIVQGVENYNNRPIIYDASDLLFDSGVHSGGCFTLKISSDGVNKVKFIPLIVRTGRTLRAKSNADDILADFRNACREFSTDTFIYEGCAEINFTPPPRQTKIISDVAGVKTAKNLIAPPNKPRPEWIVDKVPDAAIISPKNFGGLKLVGYYVPPDSRILSKRKIICVETYWTIEEPPNKDFRLSGVAAPIRECLARPFVAREQQFLDFRWPVERWKPGVIYREVLELVPPKAALIASVDLLLKLEVKRGTEIIGEFKDSEPIKLQIPDLRYPYCKTEFDDIIYRSEPGKCWTAEQIAKVTGGEWIVPPPENWCAQSFPRSDEFDSLRPNLLRVSNFVRNKQSILDNIDKFDAAMVSQSVEGLPPNFPLLKVKDVSVAMRELGIAALKRFQGRVIAVTGSAGKTTTCNMLSCVLGKDHKIKATPGSANVYGNIPRIFANLNQDDAFAIIEMSINAFAKLPGSITYEITPDVAVVTSILPAHTGSGGSLDNLAKYKCKIFCGMSKGSYAVINRDMLYYEVFEEKAKSFGLNLITFGTHPDAFIRMPVIEDGGNFSVMGQTYTLSCPIPIDQLYDALAVIGVSIAVGFSIEKTLEYLKTFEIVEGRGNILKSDFNGKSLTIINSAYNANPISMKYALSHLKNIQPVQKLRVAVLGDIADLGDQAAALHEELAPVFIDAATDRLLLCGEFMRRPYELIKDKVNTVWFKTLDELLKNVEAYLHDGDTVLIKSSHDTGLSKVVELLSQ